MNTRVIPAIGLNLARRCRSVLLAQLYYAERELLLCCGVLSAFLGFFGSLSSIFCLKITELFAKCLPKFTKIIKILLDLGQIFVSEVGKELKIEYAEFC